jgi:hypothetical protein
VYRDTAYFDSADCAQYVRDRVRVEFPEARVVEYERGYAVQTRKSGDYLGANLRPTMETRMVNFSNACGA